MKFTTTQKLIKVGSSNAVTLPAKDLRRLGAKTGESIKITFEKAAPDATNDHAVEVVKLTQDLIKRHEQALKNLSQR